MKEFPKEQLSKLNDYFDGEERRENKQNGEVIIWLEMSEAEIEEILSLKLSYKIYLATKKEKEQEEAFYKGTLSYYELKEYERTKK